MLRAFRPWLEALANRAARWSRVWDLVSPNASGDNRRNAAARAVERGLQTLARSAGVVRVHPHRLRRTYAVEFLRAMRGDPEALPKLVQHMGWADMSTALEYIDHARGAELDEVADRIFAHLD